MLPNINSRQMAQAMRKMGIKQTEIDAELVIIRCSDKEIIITSPSVAKVNMMGQESFQISGQVSEKALGSEISKEDIETVAVQANVSLEQAEKAIKECNGDLAEAILKLNESS